ncbi:hypothetical protein KSP40_PGU015683 [Platanthera guangdongensis]|uniref:Pectinesterase inhibitor domain-containing protein n=1 Tax=Platanthera guangdongensis TaxID=2320717 RepID=A0ABR2LY55_9ASPA
MRRPPTTPLLLLLLLLALSSSLLHPAASTTSHENLLKFFCKHTNFAQLCLKSIHEAEPALPTVNTATVLAALIKAADAKTREARAVAQNLAAGSGFNARTVELLRDCIDFYGEALDHLESAKEAVRAGDPGTRDAMLSAMISDFSTCDEGFEEFGVKSPLAVWCQTLRNMTDNCLAIASLARPQGGY